MTIRLTKRAAALAAGGAMLFLAGFAVTAAPDFAATPATVTISNFAFSPANLTVAAGSTVTWTNTDDEPHTIASATADKPFKSGGLDTNDSFAVNFDRPGTYTYFCSIHPQMTGTITVK
jgi:plastocyanin